MAEGTDGETEMVSTTPDSALAEKCGRLMQKRARLAGETTNRKDEKGRKKALRDQQQWRRKNRQNHQKRRLERGECWPSVNLLSVKNPID